GEREDQREIVVHGSALLRGQELAAIAAARAAMTALSRRCRVLQVMPNTINDESMTRNGGTRSLPRSRTRITDSTGLERSTTGAGGLPPNGTSCFLTGCTWTIV